MGFTKDQVLEALKRVEHPKFNKNVVGANMVEDLAIEGNKISFSLVFMKPDDPMIIPLREACEKAISGSLGKAAFIEGNIHIKTLTGEYAGDILPGVKNIIAIASGKGGVGKSTVAANLAVALAKNGNRVGLIDADIYGPSIPMMFGIADERPQIVKIGDKEKIMPIEKHGIAILSIGFFVDPGQALIWRGPMATSALKQLLSDAQWGKLDYMVIDLPPGTGDIHLTLVQTIPVTGAVIVSTPQDVALADARKGVAMFMQEAINVPVLGLIENMAWFTPDELPDNKYYIFGKDGCRKLAAELNIELLGQIPLVQSICESGDAGSPVVLSEVSPEGKAFMETADKLAMAVKKRNDEKAPTHIVGIK